jgi:predicted nucleic-acid-binding protein
VRITPDTNLLVRALTHDDRPQAVSAETELVGADVVALSLVSLCELAWVLRRSYRVSSGEIAEGIRRLAAGDNVAVDRAAVDAGLALLDAGGDFADGVIAYQGRLLGADIFVSFDRRAVRRLEVLGEPARLLS